MSVDSPDPTSDPLAWLQSQRYRLGSVQAMAYNRTRTEFFQPQPYLPYLWRRTRDSGRSQLGSLPALYCGMADLSVDAITSYLAGRLVLVLGEYHPVWEAPDPNSDTFLVDHSPSPSPRPRFPDQFRALGYCFPATLPITTSADSFSNSLFIGYTFFQESWRSPQQYLLTLLGLSFMFQEFRLEAVHGVRYADNRLTARWAQQFGFQDCGTVPSFMRDTRPGSSGFGKLTAGTISTLSRERFAEVARGAVAIWLAGAAESGDHGRQGIGNVGAGSERHGGEFDDLGRDRPAAAE